MRDETPAVPMDLLLQAESRLDRSFAVAALTMISALAWPVIVYKLWDEPAWATASILAWGAAGLAAYLWYAYAAMIAAGHVGRSRLLVAGWIVLAPLVGLFAPLVFPGDLGPLLRFGTRVVLVVSPLSLKFILASELRAEIHDRTFAD